MSNPSLHPEPGRMTVDDWAELPEDFESELVDGAIVEEEMGSWIHEVVVAWLIRVLGNWADGSGAVVAGSDARFGVRRDRGRKGDVSVYLRGDRRPPARGLIRVPPSVLVEVVTPTPRDARRDRVEKLDDYAAFGVRWYWIVDPELRTFEVFELGADGRYVHALGASAGIVDVPGCEGLRVDLDALWRAVDSASEHEA